MLRSRTPPLRPFLRLTLVAFAVGATAMAPASQPADTVAVDLAVLYGRGIEGPSYEEALARATAAPDPYLQALADSLGAAGDPPDYASVKALRDSELAIGWVGYLGGVAGPDGRATAIDVLRDVHLWASAGSDSLWARWQAATAAAERPLARTPELTALYLELGAADALSRRSLSELGGLGYDGLVGYSLSRYGRASWGGRSSIQSYVHSTTGAFERPPVHGERVLPGPWSSGDVGDVAAAGSASFDAAAGRYTVSGSGDDIWATADEFHFAHRPLSGDGSVTARVVSQTDTHPGALAGVMVRESLDPGSAHALASPSPSENTSLYYRTSNGGPTTWGPRSSTVGAPQWVRLERVGDVLAFWESTDGLTWTKVGTATVPMGRDVYAGLAVSSLDDGALSTAVFEGVTVVEGLGASGGLPPGWSSGDVGDVAAAGSASFDAAAGRYTVSGSGDDIWATADEFHFAHRPLSGDGSVTARVVSQTDTHPGALAGVMVRESLDPGSAHALASPSPSENTSLYYRTSNGGPTTWGPRSSTVGAPQWVRLERVGDVLAFWESTDGLTWTKVGTATVPMGRDVYAGLAVSSLDDGALSTAVFSEVAVAESGE